VQEDIDVIGGTIGRNVLQANFQSAAHKIDNQRPLEVAIAISAHNGDAWSDRLQFVKNRCGTNIAKMPDLIGVRGHPLHALRQAIVRVRQNKHALSLFGFSFRSHVAL
jgi:hypothetical protein